MRRYDEESKGTERKDFLAQLREKQNSGGKISQRDIVNHVSNNL